MRLIPDMTVATDIAALRKNIRARLHLAAF